jgi:hypothetical protein
MGWSRSRFWDFATVTETWKKNGTRDQNRDRDHGHDGKLAEGRSSKKSLRKQFTSCGVSGAGILRKYSPWRDRLARTKTAVSTPASAASGCAMMYRSVCSTADAEEEDGCGGSELRTTVPSTTANAKGVVGPSRRSDSGEDGAGDVLRRGRMGVEIPTGMSERRNRCAGGVATGTERLHLVGVPALGHFDGESMSSIIVFFWLLLILTK